MTKRKWTREEIDKYRDEHSIFYFNKEDSNLFIPKQYGIGLTINWANPFSWVLVAAIIGLIIYRGFNRY